MVASFVWCITISFSALGTYAQRGSLASPGLVVSDLVHNAAATPTTPALAVWPAPFGRPELTRALTVLPLHGVVLGLYGMSGGGWTELTGLANAHWQVTPTFLVATNVWWGCKGASGFAWMVDASSDIVARVMVDSAWFVGLGIDELIQYSGNRFPAMRRLRFGVSYAGTVDVSGDIEATPHQPACVMLSSVLRLDEVFHLRLTLRTQPLSLAVVLRMQSSDILPVSVGVEYIPIVGTRTMVAVEL